MPPHTSSRPSSRLVTRVALATLAVLVALMGCTHLDDILSPGKREPAAQAPAQVGLSAQLPSLARNAAASVQLRVQSFYQRADDSRVPITTQVITLEDVPTQQVPLTIDLSACLADTQRKGAGTGAECLVLLDVTLLLADRTVDAQTVGPLHLQAGVSTTVAEP